jgi:CRP-like cAMP-binding protein
MAKSASFKNQILSRLTPDDLARLEPDLNAVDLPLLKVLERRNRPIKSIYFPESGIASVVAQNGKRSIEVGLIGREGMTGLAVVLGDDRNEHETYMQAPGEGHRIEAVHLREAITESRSLHAAFLRFVRTYLSQTSSTAVANGRSTIEERLARWLLMADDRIVGDELPLTHEFLAMMLAVRRPGVTVAVQELERTGLIARKRGHIFILDREGLQKMTNGTYVPV